jgi:hypothetical protein
MTVASPADHQQVFVGNASLNMHSLTDGKTCYIIEK